MAEKTAQLVLEGLSRAVAEPSGRPLFGTKKSPGLFAASASAKQAAQHCKEAGYVEVVRTETTGKHTHEICTITDKGVGFLLSQVSVKPVLQEFVRAVEAREQQMAELVTAAQRCGGTLESLKAQVGKVLNQVGSQEPGVRSQGSGVNGHAAHGLAVFEPPAWKKEAMAHLSQWQATHAHEDCPLPTLYQRAKHAAPTLTIGQFHDGLRQLHDQQQIYLHPWTGPLYEIPEPAYAVLIGHAVVYYASRKT